MGFHSELEGADLHAPSNVLVKNETGSAISPLKVVKYDGFNGTNPKVTPVTTLTDVIAGVAIENIANNGTALIAAFGNILNVDTSSFTESQSLFMTSSGDITGTVTDVRLGTVLKVGVTDGIMFVNTVTLSNTFRTDTEIKTQYENNADAQVFKNLAIINGTLITSLISGFEVTVNVGDTSLIDIAAGKMYVTSLSGPETSTGVIVSKTAQIGLAHPAGAVSRVTLDSSGDASVTVFTGHLTQSEKRLGNLQLKVITHLGGLSTSPVDATFTFISALFGDTHASNDKLFADGIIIQDGLGIIRNANLTIGRESGAEFHPFAPGRYVTPDNPRNFPYSLAATHDFFHAWMGNDINSVNISAIIDDVDSNSWDDPTLAPTVGSPAGTLSGNEAQNFSVHEAPNDAGTRFALQYGRIKYPTVGDALSGAVAEMRRINHLQVLGTSFRGILSVPRAVTNLSTQAFFTAPISRNTSTLRGNE